MKTCGAASANTCDQQLNTRVLGAPDRGSQPAPGRWADPTNYGGNVDSFFRGEVAKLQWSQQDIVSINGADVTSKYIPFKNEPKSLAALGFCGCVGVIVMSRSAVWMAHITEDPVLTNEETFKRNGLDVLENGSGTDDMYYGLADLKDNVFAANQDPVIVVFAPKDESGEFKYRNLMAQVDDLVENCKFIPGLVLIPASLHFELEGTIRTQYVDCFSDPSAIQMDWIYSDDWRHGEIRHPLHDFQRQASRTIPTVS